MECLHFSARSSMSRSRNLFRYLLALALGTLVGCRAADVLSSRATAVTHPIAGLPRALTTSESQLVTANNTFAFNVFRAIAESAGPDSNVFVSPLSVAMTLGMAYNGAAGTTQDQMQQVLGFGGMALPQVNQSYQSLIALLRALDPGVTLTLANSVWYDQGFAPAADFVNATQTYFDATVQSLDFTGPGAPVAINQWVSTATHGKIQTIVSDPLPPDLVMLLANAIYFKGSWTNRFDSTRTQPSAFTLRTGDAISVPMMSNKGGVRAWWWSDLTTMDLVDLPYAGDAFRMTIILPKTSGGLDSLLRVLTSDSLKTLLGKLDSTTVDLHLPKFTFSYGRSLNDVLGALGMPSAFCESGSADFAGMGLGPVCISQVVHKAFVDVNETGTEAAAATSASIDICYGCFPPVVVDHPFLFVIRERFSGAILFMGRVMNPATASM